MKGGYQLDVIFLYTNTDSHVNNRVRLKVYFQAGPEFDSQYLYPLLASWGILGTFPTFSVPQFLHL